MFVNSSSFNFPGKTIYFACQASIGSKITNTMYSLFSTFLLLPLYILILYMGFHRWRSQSSAPAGTKMSHTDFFTYNMMILEILCVLGSVLYTFSIYIDNTTTFMSGIFLFNLTLPAQTLFHVLTSMERYLAVVHPITYMHLRESLGVRIRNFNTVCVWLLSFGWEGIAAWYLPGFPTIPFFSLLGLCVSALFFCCLSVLQALTQPRPGELDKKEKADQSKQKAFQMIVAITGALLLRIGGLSLCLGLSDLSLLIDLGELCAVMDSGMWLTVPSSLVLPLLFLHRAGKLSCSRNKPAV